ncbi:phosphoglycerate kinase [Bhargavaea cecembensis]|uniref:Phosphoglycerate kinase n=1 Tax=Bhargavaea cecembensis TaxID=394098 RepID=A0A165HGC8_9BACL|nr:histidine phosphatase family protein [Bhargavaea cecembensis]KZE39858.1 phosphoglycerate kinase [Bhargavaea cecembensis]
MKRIGFVRHGVTTWNQERKWQGHSDIPLAPEGIAEAEKAAVRLADEDWEIIYASPLKRALRTAEIISKENPGIPLVTDDRLVEVYGGQLEGTTEQDRVERWGSEWRSLLPSLGMEPDEDMVARGVELLEEIRKRPEENVLLVTHGGFIRRLLQAVVPDLEQSDRILNTSVTVVEMQDDRNLCTLYNCTKHLSDA